MHFFKKLTKKQKILFIIFSVLTLFLICFIFSNSLKNGADSSEDSEKVSKIVAKLINFVFNTKYTTADVGGYVRTFAHFSEFAALSFCCANTIRLISDKMKKAVLISLPFTFLVAITDEIIQIFSEGRAFQFIDIGIDTLGCLFGIAFLNLILKLFNKLSSQK